MKCSKKLVDRLLLVSRAVFVLAEPWFSLAIEINDDYFNIIMMQHKQGCGSLFHSQTLGGYNDAKNNYYHLTDFFSVQTYNFPPIFCLLLQQETS